ncbi:MAG: ArgR family transcriptional regulator [Spirochaetales bacterium]|nr:ArgR family transcriptional regulator [Spirochaetales bacterium]
MKEREARLSAIKRLINNRTIHSQEELLDYLIKENYKVTQATLSRDLKLLKVGKISDGWKGYYYSMPGEEERRDSESIFIQDVQRAFLSIKFSGNLAVIHTLPGHADSVAYAMDKLNISELIGTIAGDDTIFAVLREGSTYEEVREILKKRIPNLEI